MDIGRGEFSFSRQSPFACPSVIMNSDVNAATVGRNVFLIIENNFIGTLVFKLLLILRRLTNNLINGKNILKYYRYKKWKFITSNNLDFPLLLV